MTWPGLTAKPLSWLLTNVESTYNPRAKWTTFGQGCLQKTKLCPRGNLILEACNEEITGVMCFTPNGVRKRAMTVKASSGILYLQNAIELLFLFENKQYLHSLTASVNLHRKHLNLLIGNGSIAFHFMMLFYGKRI